MNFTPRRLAIFCLAFLAIVAAVISFPNSVWERTGSRNSVSSVASEPGRRETESRPPVRSQTEFGNEGSIAVRTAGATARRSTGAPPFDRFNSWAAEYVAAAPEARPALLSRGIAAAAERRPALAALIKNDPREALESAVPMVVRQELPPEIVALLEERVNVRGFFGVLGVVPGSAPEPAIRREVRTDDGTRFRAHVYGERTFQKTTERAPIAGIAIDRELAVSERRVRPLETGEIPDASKPIAESCPISGLATAVVRTPGGALPAITPETPAVEAGGVIYYLCHGGHIIELEEKMIAAEGSTGGALKPSTTIATTDSTGVKTLLYLRLAFPESRAEPQTEAAAYDMLRQVNDFFVEGSYGNLYLLPTVAPLVVLPRTVAWYNGGGGDEFDVRTDALAAAKAMGYDSAQYDLNIVAYSGGPGSFGGLGYVGGVGVWLKSINVGVACHELGHNVGLWHANFWDTSGRSVIGEGAHAEYGNGFDTMGAAGAGNQHFNANHKNQLGWLTKEYVHDIRQSGTYRIFAFDQPQLDTANRYSFKIKKDSARSYWGEFRQKYGSSNTWLRDGILLDWSPWAKSAGGAHLLDTTPGSPDGKTDSAVTIGRTFDDTEAGIHITPISKNGTTPESVDVVVNLGAFPGNHAPVATVGASATAAALNATVNFTATASDADGDALAYAWDFGDKTFSSTSAPTASKSWSAAGDYVVRCVVSDMKGMAGSASVVVRVGSPGTYAVSGQITLGGQPLANVRVSNGGSGTGYHGAFSDSDGNYKITGLTGSTTITAALDGETFAASGFTNPLNVTANVTGANFTASVTPVVTLSASDPTATEGPTDAGAFTITRTGSTASALTVALSNSSGSASKGSDYTLSPDLTNDSANNQYTLTIPAGQASLMVTLTALDDTNSEGPESATLELLPGAGYVISGSESATITILDTDATVPQVTIQLLDADASETGDPATILFARSGPTTAALTVNFTRSGAAQNGVDYADIGTSIVIPAGQSSVPLVIQPINDSLIEGDEDLTITLSSSATYVRNSAVLPVAVTATITDDDVPTVTIVATDATASEAGLDPAVFVVTRTGDVSAPLTVNYALGGSAHHGVDYATLPGVLTIPAGSNVGSITVTPIDDSIGEPTQTIIVQIRSSIGYAVGAAGNATANLLDDDVPVVTVGVSDGNFGEPGDAGSFKFTTTGSGSGNITIHYTVSGTATSGVDFTALPGTLSLGKNTTATVTVTALDDTESEDMETVTLTIDPDPAYTTFLDRTATLNLLDDEHPLVSVTPTNDFFGEVTNNRVKYWISRQGSTVAALTVHFAMSGTGTEGADYQTTGGSATIPAGVAGVLVELIIISDTIKEGTETAIMTILPDTAYGLGFASATQYLPDAQSPSVLAGFTAATGSGSESVGIVQIPVALNTAAATPVTMEYAINGGSALGGVDYVLDAGVLTFDPGVTTLNIPLTIIDDLFPEPNQTVAITLKNGNGVALGSKTYTFTILDNDPAAAATIGFAGATASGAEAISPGQIVVSLSAAQNSAVSVDFAVTGGTAVNGTDFAITNGTLTFAPGETAKIVPNSIVNNTVLNANRTIILTLGNAAGAALNANTTHTYTILDDDAATLTIAASVATTNEAGGSPGQFTVTRTGSLANALTVNLTIAGTATNGTDYATIPATLTLPAGQPSATIAVTPIDDALGEGNETVVATLAAGSYTIGSPGTATVTIVDDEPTVSITATDPAAAELGLDPGVFTITRGGSTVADLSVNVTIAGTATSGTDFVALTNPVTIPAGSASTALTVTPIDDTIAEGNETVVATIAAGAYLIGAPSTATVVISDDDINNAPVVTILSPTISNIGIPSGVGLILEATATDDGKPVSPGVLTKTWSKVSGPGTVTFGNVSQPNTTATFSAGGSYVLRLTASDGSLQATADAAVFVGGTPALVGTDVGGPTPAGSFTLNSGTYNISANSATNGLPSTSTPDGFYFLEQQMTGDVTITARIVSVQNVNAIGSSSRAGVMIRQSLAGDSMHAFSAVTSVSGGRFNWRPTAAANAQSASLPVALPYWVRLIRTGNSFTGQLAPDTAGTPGTFTTLGAAQTINMTGAVYVGLASTSGVKGVAGAVVVDHLTVSTWPTNIGPNVDAGSDASVTLPTPTSLDGILSDDGKPTPVTLTSTWVKASGPGTVTFADASDPITSATFSAPGNYVLRLIANDGQIKTFDDMAVSTSLPVVSVQATTAAASETGPAAGRFTITRTGSTDFPLTVQLSVGGTATNGTDDAALPASITLPIGSTTGFADVTPLADTLAEGDETVVLGIAANAAYVLGTPDTATVTIADSSADQWRFSHFGANANNPAIAGDGADPDGDSLPNLYEYAAGFDPLALNSERPVVGFDSGDLTLTYRRRTNASDLTYSIEQADSAGVWTAAKFTETLVSDDGPTRLCRAHVDVGPATAKIIRLRITRP